MAFSDSMFLFEIVVEKFNSYMHCKEFSIKSKFVDVFTLNLREPDDGSGRRERKVIKPNRKLKVRSTTTDVDNNPSKAKIQTGQSVLLANSIEWLTSHMSTHPLELSLWSKKYPGKKLGGTSIPWSKLYISYLNKLNITQDLPPVMVNGNYNIINESKSKCIASITLSVKLSHLKGTNMPNDNTHLRPKIDILKINNDATNKLSHSFQGEISTDPETSNNIRNIYKERKDFFLKIVKSDIQVNKNGPIDLLQSKSLSTLFRYEKVNPLTYIFGCPKGLFGNRVYCVNYFTVENDVSGKANSPKETSENIEEPKGRYHLKLCDSQCPMKPEGSCSQSICSLDLPEEAGHLINITKCKKVECDNKKQSERTPPDDRILLNLTNLKSECCNYTEKIEKVVGGVSGKMKIGDDPCFCTCECRFGFTKKTTYCTVCGGYEIVGEELVPTSENQKPFPCPIFHKLIDKNKLKTWSTSGSESKKKGDDQSIKSMKVSSGPKAAATTKRQATSKSVESEKDSKKGTKKKKDDRFKFNYGYKAPQIGHSECAMPCTGTLGAVPKNMGWLWTAEDIPGMKVKYGWKPGAISKRLLKALNKAKLLRSVVQRTETRRVKRRIKEKPALIVSRVDGEYTIEMNAPHPKDGLAYTPLIYRIEAADNKARIKKKNRKQRRLMRAAVKETWNDPYHPEYCESVCRPAYEKAIGFDRDREADEYNDEEDELSCSCSDEEISSSCSSSDVDWELQFSPPSAFEKHAGRETSYVI